MKWMVSVSTCVLLASTSLALEAEGEKKDKKEVSPAIELPGNVVPFITEDGGSSRCCTAADWQAAGPPGFLTGNRNFQNFIGFMSNPIQSIDPRAVTEIWPMFGSAWVSGNHPALPDGNAQVYGAGLYVALSDRLSVGLNQGGYAVIDTSRDRERILRNRGLVVPDRDLGGQREGWLNLGGFVQYTLIEDVPSQFLLTAGLRWEAPSGASSVFQGSPAYLAPYVTIGKEFGHFHFLATTGYEFPAGTADSTTRTIYANVHLDRQFGWFYPLVELNGSYNTTRFNLNLPTHQGLLDLGTFQASGNILTAAVGANTVLIPSKFEVGAVYVKPITSQNRFDFDGLLVKMVYRY